MGHFHKLFQDVLLYGPTCFEIKFYSIKLILLCYNTYLRKFCSLYLFEYLFNAPQLAENTSMVPNSSLFTQSHQPICLFKMSFFCIHGNRLLVYYFLFIRQRRQVIAVKTLSLYIYIYIYIYIYTYVYFVVQRVRQLSQEPVFIHYGNKNCIHISSTVMVQ